MGHANKREGDEGSQIDAIAQQTPLEGKNQMIGQGCNYAVRTGLAGGRRVQVQERR